MRVLRHIVRRPFAQLASAALGTALAFAGNAGVPSVAANQPARPVSGPTRTPDKAMHTEFVVEVNAKGQVSRVRSGKSSHDAAFNTMTYGNALQAFIRTPDDKSISGTYRLTYDYNPRTKRVKRGASLLHAGGVDPSAMGAVDAMAVLGSKHPAGTKPSGTASPLPDFKSITGHR